VEHRDGMTSEGTNSKGRAALASPWTGIENSVVEVLAGVLAKVIAGVLAGVLAKVLMGVPADSVGNVLATFCAIVDSVYGKHCVETDTRLSLTMLWIGIENSVRDVPPAGQLDRPMECVGRAGTAQGGQCG